MVKQDPRFYVRLGAWYSDHGDVRDHKEMFAITLILSDFPGHRDVGLAMLRELPPYQVVRVLDFIHGRKTTRKVRDGHARRRDAERARRPSASTVRARKERGTGAARRCARSRSRSACSRTRRGRCGRKSSATCASGRRTPTGSTAPC
jgi:hypothetical protein